MSEVKATKKEEREARKQLREAERLQKKQELQAAIDAATPLLKPHCWTFIHDKLRRQVKLKKPNKATIENLMWRMNLIPSFTQDECLKFAESVGVKP